MKFEKNKSKKLSTYFLLLASFLGISTLYMSCSSKQDRSFFIKNSLTHQIEEDFQVEPKKSGVVEPTLSPNLDILNETNQLDEEYKELMNENFMDLMEVFSAFTNPKKAFSTVYGFLEDSDLKPTATTNQANVTVISSDYKFEGLGYFRSRFDSDNNPVYFVFEVDAVKGGFNLAKELLEKYYPDLGKPCFESVNNAVAYKSNGYLIRLYEYTKDDILMGHPDKPRLEEHIGAVEVVIERDIHPDRCGANFLSIKEDSHHHETH